MIQLHYAVRQIGAVGEPADGRKNTATQEVLEPTGMTRCSGHHQPSH